jgi:hypothetical protein
MAAITGAYCSIDQILALNQHRTYSASTKPTLTEVKAFATGIANRIDALLAELGYETPVTDATGKSILSWINAYGAASLAEQAQAGLGPVRSQHADFLWEKFEVDLETIQKGLIKLGSASKTSDALLTQRQQQLSYQFSVTDGTEDDPVFTRDMKF